MSATRPSLFARLFRRTPTTIRRPKPAARPALGLTTLEGREVPATLSGSTLWIVGTNGVDNVQVTQTTANYGYSDTWSGDSKVKVVHNGTTQSFSSWSFWGTGTIRFLGNGGNDVFQSSASIPVDADGGPGMDVLSGGPMDDLLKGGPGNEHDALYGNGGIDLIWGGGGPDEIRGGEGDDTLAGDGENDTVRGGPGNDTIYGNDGHDTMYGDNNAGAAGGIGNDTLYGGAGNDTLVGEDGNDYLRGELNTDYLYGNNGDDILYGDNAGNNWGGESADYLYGGWGNDWMYGEGGNDWMYGEGDNDAMYGGTGADYMYGQEGNDGLFGGLGWTDTLMGGGGNNRFLMPQNSGEEVSDYRYNALFDARIVFRSGGAAEYAGTSYVAGAWTDREVERIDEALNIVHQATGGPVLLRTGWGGPIEFVRQGGVERGYYDGAVHLTNAQVFNTDEYLRGYTLHELAHEFHYEEVYQNLDIMPPGMEGFAALSGWTYEDPDDTAYSLSVGQDPDNADDNWWYYSTAAFASEYAKTNLAEDFAESFSAYFTQLAFLYNRDGADWNFYEGPGAAAIPEKMALFSQWVSGL